MKSVAVLFFLVACSSSQPVGGDASDDGTTPIDASDAAAVDAGDADASIVPYACASNAPEAVFINETPPPGKMFAWDVAPTSVTYANCGKTTWSSKTQNGIFLGFAAPHDLPIFMQNRIWLPDVPPAHAVTIAFKISAPPLTGKHAFALELVREGIAWLGQPSPMHVIEVQARPGPPIQICAGGVMADPTGTTDAHNAIQQCIDATTANGTLMIPPGIYRLSGVISITKPMTLTTANDSIIPDCLAYFANQCAVFRADDVVSPVQAGTRGFVRLGTLGSQVSGVTIDHVLIDGNRDARLQSGPAAQCAAGNNGDGINIGANCAGCTIRNVTSARALCGTGLEWDGDDIKVYGSTFFGNGDHTSNNMWSDGLTIHKSNNAVVDKCAFIDNSDVGFISGGGTNAKYTNNVALQLSQVAFAAMMLDNFNSGQLGDHTGAVMSGNSVACPAGCHFGIELGPHPWYPSPNILGGTVSNNTVVGANIEINAQGTGTQNAPTVITNNTLGPVPASGKFQCGNVNGTTPLNVANDSVVDLKGGMKTGSISVPCP